MKKKFKTIQVCNPAQVENMISNDKIMEESKEKTFYLKDLFPGIQIEKMTKNTDTPSFFKNDFHTLKINISKNEEDPEHNLKLFDAKLSTKYNMSNPPEQYQRYDNTLIIFCKEGKITKFVVKRNWIHYINKDPNKLLDVKSKDETYLSILSKLEDNYNEYKVTEKLYNLNQKYFPKPYEFSMTFLEKKNLLINESITDFCGDPLSSTQTYSTDQIVSIFKQMLDILYLLEIENFSQNDIKPGNILINSDNGSLNVKLIDFGLAGCNKNEVHTVNGYTFFYCSPEISRNVQLIKACMEKFKSENKIHINKKSSEIFSLGVVMLEILGVLEVPGFRGNFSEYKSSKENYVAFLKIIDEMIYSNEYDKIRKKLIMLSKLCVPYEPENRLSPKEMLYLISTIGDINENKIENRCHKIFGTNELKIKNNLQENSSNQPPNLENQENINVNSTQIIRNEIPSPQAAISTRRQCWLRVRHMIEEKVKQCGNEIKSDFKKMVAVKIKFKPF